MLCEDKRAHAHTKKSVCGILGTPSLRGVVYVFHTTTLPGPRGPLAPVVTNTLFSLSLSLSPEEQGLCFLNIQLPGVGWRGGGGAEVTCKVNRALPGEQGGAGRGRENMCFLI